MKKADFPSDEAFKHAAVRLCCEEAAIRAVAAVEAGPEGAFLDTGEPVILFERHIFHRLTGGKYDGATAPNVPGAAAVISKRRPGGYGRYSDQHPRLQGAAALDREAALKSASWGLFQILGVNHAQAGHGTIQSFVNAMYRSVDDHLSAFVSFILKDERLVMALRTKKWADFARIYNGPNYAKNRYDVKMREAFSEFNV